MYAPPEEYDSDEDLYDGFSFGNEFDQVWNQKKEFYNILPLRDNYFKIYNIFLRQIVSLVDPNYLN